MPNDGKQGRRHALLALLVALIGILGWLGFRSPGTGRTAAAPPVTCGGVPAVPPAPGPAPSASSGAQPSKPPESPAIPESPEACAVLSGRVLDRESGEPVEGASVSWRPLRWEGGRVVKGVATGPGSSRGLFKTVGSDREGCYRIEIPAPESGQRYALWIFAGSGNAPVDPIWLPEAMQERADQPADPKPDLTEAAWKTCTFPSLGPGEERVQDIRVPSSYDLFVEVLSADGQPVPGEMVMTFVPADPRDEDDLTFRGGGILNGRGVIEMKGISARDYPPENARFRIDLNGGYAPIGEHRLSEFPRTGRRIEAHLTAVLAGGIEGLVSYPDGSPCGKGLIFCCRDLGPEEVKGEEITAEEATAELLDAIRENRKPGKAAGKLLDKERNLWCLASLQEDGTFRVGIPADAKGHRLFLMVAEVCDARMDTPREVTAGERVHIVLEAGGTVAGRVLDDKAVPVPGAFVHGSGGGMQSCSCTTDAQGRFRLKGLPRQGTLAVRWLPDVRRAEQAKLPVSGWTGVPVGTENLEIILTSEGGLRPYP